MSDTRFRDKEYSALLIWKMCSDPWPADPTAKAYVRDMLNAEAEARGFEDWVEAYHELDIEQEEQ